MNILRKPNGIHGSWDIYTAISLLFFSSFYLFRYIVISNSISPIFFWLPFGIDYAIMITFILDFDLKTGVLWANSDEIDILPQSHEMVSKVIVNAMADRSVTLSFIYVCSNMILNWFLANGNIVDLLVIIDYLVMFHSCMIISIIVYFLFLMKMRATIIVLIVYTSILMVSKFYIELGRWLGVEGIKIVFFDDLLLVMVAVLLFIFSRIFKASIIGLLARDETSETC